jgi:uncharacterized membrane-anchored protein YjiN (DUF445 family)
MLSSLLSIFGCKGQTKEKEKDKINQQVDKSIEDFLKRPIYSVLTVNILDSVENDKLEQTIIDNILSKLDSNDSSEKQYEIIKSLSKGRQSIFSTWVLEGEVNNGGFNQYFYNFASSGQYAEEARDGFKLINAIKHAALTQKAIDVILKNAKKLSKFKDGTLESFSKSYENNPLNPLDNEFYGLGKIENLSELRIKYIRDHLLEFIDN